MWEAQIRLDDLMVNKNPKVDMKWGDKEMGVDPGGIRGNRRERDVNMIRIHCIKISKNE